MAENDLDIEITPEQESELEKKWEQAGILRLGTC